MNAFLQKTIKRWPQNQCKILTVLLPVMIIFTACRPAPFECADEIGCVAIAPGEPVKIGVVQALSGATASIGQEQLRSIQLALARRDNMLLGHPVELQIEDAGCSEEGGTTTALKLAADPQIIGVVGTTCSGSGATAGQILSKAGLVMISGANSAPSLTSPQGKEKGSDWQPGYFRTMFNGATISRRAAQFAVEKMGITRAATINDGDVYTRGLVEHFERAFTGLGGKIVLSASVNKGDKEMKPLLSAIAAHNAELLYFPVFHPEGSFLVQQRQDVPGLDNVLFLSTTSLLNVDFFEAAGEQGKGAYFISDASPTGPAHQTLLDSYQKKYNHRPQHSTYVFAYDATNLLLNAIEQVAEKDAATEDALHIGRATLRQAIYKTQNFEGVSGRLSCNPFGDCNTVKFNVMRLDKPDAGLEGVKSNVIASY